MKRKCETVVGELPFYGIPLWCPKMGVYRMRIGGQIYYLCMEHKREFTAAQN